MRCGSIHGVLSTGALRAHLLAARLAGPVATTRENSLRSYRLFAARDPRVLLGLTPERTWGEPEVLRLMAERCGVSADPAHVSGPDAIDPERTVAALDAFAERLGRVAALRARCCWGPGIRTGCWVSTPGWQTPCRRWGVLFSPRRRGDVST